MSSEDDVLGTLNITGDQFQNFLNEREISSRCSCGKGDRKIAQEPDGRPSLNALTDPRDHSSENWFFWTVCTNCLRADFYSAGHIWMHLKSKANGK